MIQNASANNAIAADKFTTDLYDWIQQEITDNPNARFRTDLRRYLRRYVGQWDGKSLEIDQTGGARGVDYIIGDTIGIVISDSVTGGSNQWMYRELGTIGERYGYVIVIGHDLAEEHLDSWRSLERRMTNRSNTTFRFMTTQNIGDHKPIPQPKHKVVNRFLTSGAILATWFSICLNVFLHIETTDPMSLAFIAGVFVFLTVIILYMVFFVGNL